MYWFNQSELAYYHPNTNGYCYCEELLSPTDLMLQARIPKVNFEELVLRLRVYTPDGVTVSAGGSVIEDYCKFIIATDVNGDYYINIQCQSFPPALCAFGQCFVLRFEVFQNVSGASTAIFDKFTQQYCLADCCSYEVKSEAGEQGEIQTFSAIVGAADLISACGKPIARIESRYPCIDNYTGDYYGGAITKIGGKNNPDLDDVLFYKVTNIEALFKRIPRDVKVTTALNCKTQKTEGAKLWMLQSSIPLPSWKMDELENMFSSNSITINGVAYTFNGGVAFEKLAVYQKDSRAEFFKLNTQFQECRKWQIFGCGDECVSRSTLRYVPIPTGQDLLKVYDPNGALIANTSDEFKVYLQSIPGETTVTDVSYAYLPYGYSTVLQVQSTGLIPSFFYLNYVGANSKLFTVADVPDLMIGCPPAVIGAVSDSANDCQPAIIGTVSDTAQGATTGSVYSQNDWVVQSGSSASTGGDTVTLNFTSRNATLGNSQGTDIVLNGDVIGVVFAPFIPAADRTIIVPGAPGLADNTAIVTTSGEIKWFGVATVTTSYASVTIVNLTYNT